MFTDITTPTADEQHLIDLADTLAVHVVDHERPTSREIRWARHTLGAAALYLDDDAVEDVLTMSLLAPEQRPLYITAMRPALRPTLANIAEAHATLARRAA